MRYSAAGPGNRQLISPGTVRRRFSNAVTELAESERFPRNSTLITADVDLGRIRQERMRFNTFRRLRARGIGANLRISATLTFALDAPNEAVALRA